MTEDLWLLTLASMLGLIQLLVAAKASIDQRGKAWAAGGRDTPGSPLTGLGGRVDRAFRNFLETFPFFAVAVLVAHAAGCRNGAVIWGGRVYLAARVVYVPAYLSDVPYLRTTVWFAALGGIIALLLAPLV